MLFIFFMKKLFAYLWLAVSSITAIPTQAQGLGEAMTSRWSLNIGSGTLIYMGDLSYKLPSGKLTPSMHLGLERRFNNGLALKGTVARGTITANDREAFGKLLEDNPNFSRSLNFKSKVTNAYLSLLYYANNGYLLKENARVYPFLSAGLGISHFQVFVDQFTNGSSQYNYWSDGTIRDIPENATNAGTIVKQDNNFETKVSTLKTEDEVFPNTSFIAPVGLGMGFRFSDHWSTQIASNFLFTFTDQLDGVGGKYATSYPEAVTEYIAIPNPNYLTPGMPTSEQYRGNSNGKKDKMIHPSISVSYHFGGNVTDKLGPVVKVNSSEEYAKAEKIRKAKANENSIVPPDSLVLDPFEDRKRDYILREREESIVYTNDKGIKDTMIVIRIDTLRRSDLASINAGARGNGPNRTMNYSTLDGSKGVEKAMDDDIVKDIYVLLQILNKTMNELETRVDKVEKKITTDVGKGNLDASSAVVNTLQSVVIYFPSGNSQLETASLDKLNTVVGILTKYPNIGVMLNGYADPAGDPVKNLMLSQERVDVVRSHLLTKTAKNYQIICQFHGAENKKGISDPAKRRVEVEFIKVR
jgi:outer membrane protein OmpA-like peptidoglycan-associated protein